MDRFILPAWTKLPGNFGPWTKIPGGPIFPGQVTYFKRRKCLDFFTDFHIEERDIIKVDEIPQALAKHRSVTVEMFCIFVTIYTKTGLTTQSEKVS